MLHLLIILISSDSYRHEGMRAVGRHWMANLAVVFKGLSFLPDSKGEVTKCICGAHAWRLAVGLQLLVDALTVEDRSFPLSQFYNLAHRRDYPEVDFHFLQSVTMKCPVYQPHKVSSDTLHQIVLVTKYGHENHVTSGG